MVDAGDDHELQIVLSGINGATGDYLFSPTPEQLLAALLR
jgi:hypothetical protein